MAQVSPQQTHPVTRVRINILLLVVVCMTVLLSQQLVRIQALQQLRGRELGTLAQDELVRHEVLQPRRGTIYDRNDVALALNVDMNSLYVDSSQLAKEDATKLALMLSPIIGRDSSELSAIIGDANREWSRLARWLSPEAAEQVAKLADDPAYSAALYLIPEAQRVYPQGEFASRITGVANYEGVGISGVEAYYDSYIKGITGTLQAERTGSNAQEPIWIAPQQIVHPQNGMDIHLTIDSAVQKIVEDELTKVIQEQEAEGATILVMDPSTGEVLGMATWPEYDPNKYVDYDPAVVNRNNAITEVYEPGSTMKVLVAAIGLQTGAFTPGTQVNDSGCVFQYGTEQCNWNGGGNGPITPAQMLYYSSNIGALRFGELIGTDNFYRYLKMLGYGQPTGIDLGGEGEGIVNWPANAGENWSDLTLNQNSFGQGIAVTPIQHLAAISTVANGGTLMWPHVVREKCQGTKCEPFKPRAVRHVFEQATTDALRPMLTENAEQYGAFYWSSRGNNIGNQPLVPGYKVAAKTGTSQISLGELGYDNNAVIGSVVGWAPAENPRVSVLVKIDRPKRAQWGIEAAIPVYQHVVARLMTQLRVPPDPGYVAEGQTIGATE